MEKVVRTMKKRLMSIILVLVLTFTCVPIGVITASASTDYTEPTIFAESKYAATGSSVEVNVNVKNNPGIAGATLSISYDSKLTLTAAKSGNSFSKLNFTAPGKFSNPSDFLWDSESGQVNDDGTMLTLTFNVADDATPNDNLNVNVSYYSGDIYNEILETVNFQTVNGCVTVIDYIPGDVNGDKTVNGKDITLLRRNIVGGYGISINESAADVNSDNRINGVDVTLIRRYIVGGYGVELKPSKPKCDHAMASVPYKAATCTENGNIAYWHCSKCEKYFSNAEGTTEITLDNTVIPAKGHTPVIDEAVPPTYDSTGLTEGSHCKDCGAVIKKQEVVPKLEKNDYSITYYVDNNDNYLQQLTIDNSNPNSYTSEKGLVLNDLIVNGYNFKGWYTAQTGGTRVTEISAGSKGNKVLYAQWEKIKYTISFKSDMVPMPDRQYTADQEIVLASPKLDKYTFVGWSDKDGKVINTIPLGTTGDITLYANWASNRNKANAVSKLKDPIILEDSEKGLFLFTYEIGTIENVPLFTTLKLNCVNGIITENSKTNEKVISTEQAKKVAQTISNATTNSSSWTLEKSWNNSTQVSQSYLDQTEQTREEAETLAKSQSNTYNLSTSLGGSNTNTSTAAGSFKLSGNQAHSETNTTETGQNFNLSVDAKYSRENSGGIKLGIPIDGLNLGINAGRKSTFEIGAGIEYGNYVKNTNTGTDSWSNSAEISGQKSCSSTSEKTWNTTEGYSSSNSTSMSSSVSNTLSKLISQQYGYGKTYSEGGSNSEAQQLASTDSKSDEFSTTMTYYSSEIESTTTSYSSTGNTTGDYRLVMAGKVHVFAVVGYDVAKQSYFVYTYNVLDDKTEEYLDYSYDGSFNDYETSIIPFEVPGFVNDFVNNKIAMTDGLRIDPDTGIIDKYTPSSDGAATIISVPSYVSLDNGDGTYRSVRVKGISSDLFKNNTDITGVILGHSITEIPDNAFEECSSLKYVIAPGVTKIGNNGFKNCSSLKDFSIPLDIAEIGSNAFENVPSIKANASNVLVAKAVASSGAKNIVLDISSLGSDEMENIEFNIGFINSFELQGKDKEYKNLRIKSDAETTVVNGVKITDATRIPLELSSQNITLNRVSVSSSGYAMLLTSDIANVTLNGNNNFTTNSGNTVICRNVNLLPLSVSVVGKMNVAGKMLVCGNIEGKEYLVCDNIEYIDEETYFQYKKGMFNITLNANGGEVSDIPIVAYYGTAIGNLPTPTRDKCTFDGWYTEDGKQIIDDTVFDYLTDITLRAHWTSDWILSSDLPEDGEVKNTKYSYDLTSYTTSSSSSMDGWTKYNTTSAWGNYGSWSGWQTGYVGGSDSRQVETRTVTDRAGYTNYKYWIYRTSDGWGYGTQNYDTGSHGRCTIYDEINLNYSLPVHNSSLGTYGPYNSSKFSHSGDSYWFSGGSWWVAPVTHTEYRYRDRSLVYTYYYKKSESLESASDPTGQNNVSNVQEWVQYRVK